MPYAMLAFVILLVIFVLPTWPYSAGWGYYPAGGLGILFVVLIIFLLLGR